MPTLTQSKTQQIPTRRNKSKLKEKTLPFCIVEAKELTRKLTPGQYSVVQSFRDMLVETALREEMNIAEMNIDFANKWRGTDEIVFTVYVIAELDEVMPFWEKFDAAQENWMPSYHELVREFVYEYFAVSVRKKRFPV